MCPPLPELSMWHGLPTTTRLPPQPVSPNLQASQWNAFSFPTGFAAPSAQPSCCTWGAPDHPLQTARGLHCPAATQATPCAHTRLGAHTSATSLAPTGTAHTGHLTLPSKWGHSQDQPESPLCPLCPAQSYAKLGHQNVGIAKLILNTN